MAASKEVFEFPKPKSDEEKAKERAALFKKLNSNKKLPPIIRTADQVASTYFLRRPCGITQLDIDTGGGLAAGGLSCLSGVDNAGKSTLLYLYCAMHQRIYGDGSMIALSLIEGNPDYFYMKKLGFNVAIPDENIIEREKNRKDRGLPKFTKGEIAYFKQQTGVVDFILGATGEQVMDTVIQLIRKNIYGILAVDSISALQSSAEASKTSFEDTPQQAADAMLLTRFLKKYYPCMNGLFGKNSTTVIFTQQVRANRNKSNAAPHMQKYIEDVIAVGANALKHGKLLDIAISKGSKERDTPAQEGKSGEVLGRTVKYKMLKGKAGTHDEITGEFDMSYERGFELERTLFVQGLRLGVITEKSGLISVHRAGDNTPLVQDIPGIETFVKMVKDSVKLELAIRKEVMVAAGKECIYHE